MAAWLRRQRSWLVVEPLPSYAPELNPVEALWSNLKGMELATLPANTLAEVIAAADHGIQRIGHTHHLAHSFLRHCGNSDVRVQVERDADLAVSEQFAAAFARHPRAPTSYLGEIGIAWLRLGRWRPAVAAATRSLWLAPRGRRGSRSGSPRSPPARLGAAGLCRPVAQRRRWYRRSRSPRKRRSRQMG